jgi:hypothetical protein
VAKFVARLEAAAPNLDFESNNYGTAPVQFIAKETTFKSSGHDYEPDSH